MCKNTFQRHKNKKSACELRKGEFMGFLDGILGSAGAKHEVVEEAQGAIPMFSITTAFRPVRLCAKKDESVELELAVKNIGEADALTSVNVDVPKGLGFDGMGIARTKEYRLGSMKGGEEKKFSVSLHGSSQTPAGNYRITISAYAHYRDYGHVLNSVKKAVELRVI